MSTRNAQIAAGDMLDDDKLNSNQTAKGCGLASNALTDRATDSDASAATADEADDDLETDAEIAAADNAEIDAHIASTRTRHCKRRQGPRELTDAMHEFARRLAAGENPFSAGLRPPCRYRRRAVRALLKSPLFIAAYERCRHPLSPTPDELSHACRPGANEPPASHFPPILIQPFNPERTQ